MNFLEFEIPYLGETKAISRQKNRKPRFESTSRSPSEFEEHSEN